MDADQIRKLKPKLMRYLGQFDDCFSQHNSRDHFSTYVEGQLSDLGEKSCEPIAVAAGVPPRDLQEFLAAYKWNEDRARNHLQQMVAREDAGPNAVGIIDETSDVKQGTKTPGVKRQWCGTRGKTENCIVTVHLAYATGDFHCLLDGDLFLPEDWSDDRDRCRAAGIPDDVVYRPKWKIALELYDRARGNGVVFDWLTFDEGYGGKPEFLREITARQQPFVAEVPKTFTAWIRAPRATERPFRRGRGRGRKTPRLRSGSRPASSVENLLTYSPELRDQPWVRYRVKDGEKGPMVWEVKHAMITVEGWEGLAGDAHAPAGGSQRAEAGGDQILRQQCRGGGRGADLVAGGLLPLACGAVLRGREAGSRARPVGGPPLAGIETAFDSHLGELPVPGPGSQATRGKKIRT